MKSFGLILVSHGPFAKAILSTIEMIMGPQKNAYTVGLDPGDGLDDLCKKIERVLENFDGNDNIFIVSDLFGGTPFNSSEIVRKDKKNIHILTGLNLPMLVQFFLTQTDDPENLAIEMVEIGRQGIQFIPKIINGKGESEALE